MQMLYNSDNFVVVRFDVPEQDSVTPSPAVVSRSRPGYEIVDKFARKEIFIEGALAERFHDEVQALMDSRPSEEEIDAFLDRFSALMQQPLVLH